jgi:hypothetical protein
MMRDDSEHVMDVREAIRVVERVPQQGLRLVELALGIVLATEEEELL